MPPILAILAPLFLIVGLFLLFRVLSRFEENVNNLELGKQRRYRRADLKPLLLWGTLFTMLSAIIPMIYMFTHIRF